MVMLRKKNWFNLFRLFLSTQKNVNDYKYSKKYKKKLVKKNLF
jgi:hypothetical protein